MSPLLSSLSLSLFFFPFFTKRDVKDLDAICHLSALVESTKSIPSACTSYLLPFYELFMRERIDGERISPAINKGIKNDSDYNHVREMADPRSHRFFVLFFISVPFFSLFFISVEDTHDWRRSRTFAGYIPLRGVYRRTTRCCVQLLWSCCALFFILQQA